MRHVLRRCFAKSSDAVGPDGGLPVHVGEYAGLYASRLHSGRHFVCRAKVALEVVQAYDLPLDWRARAITAAICLKSRSLAAMDED